jgi:hypothetical protein
MSGLLAAVLLLCILGKGINQPIADWCLYCLILKDFLLRSKLSSQYIECWFP